MLPISDSMRWWLRACLAVARNGGIWDFNTPSGLRVGFQKLAPALRRHPRLSLSADGGPGETGGPVWWHGFVVVWVTIVFVAMRCCVCFLLFKCFVLHWLAQVFNLQRLCTWGTHLSDCCLCSLPDEVGFPLELQDLVLGRNAPCPPQPPRSHPKPEHKSAFQHLQKLAFDPPTPPPRQQETVFQNLQNFKKQSLGCRERLLFGSWLFALRWSRRCCGSWARRLWRRLAHRCRCSDCVKELILQVGAWEGIG